MKFLQTNTMHSPRLILSGDAKPNQACDRIICITFNKLI